MATKHLFLLGVTLALAGACGESAQTTPDADSGLEGDPCDVCGGTHQAVRPPDSGSDDTCGSEWSACMSDPGCASIITCVFKPTHGASAADPGCAIAQKTSPFKPQYAEAAACVDTCVQKYCNGSQHSAELYLAAERCAYCGPACSGVCGTYCGALPGTATCGGSADAGGD